jgi:NTP pyrophosphatase (non-canonical NTP hydrolase)
MNDRKKKIAEIRKSAEEARKTKGSWVDGQDYADDVEFLLNELERLRNRYRPAVQWFAEQMERKLRENDHKGGWENENIYWLWERLREESKELIYAVNLTRDLHADPENIVRESADVANFAMMIADVARRMKESVSEEQVYGNDCPGGRCEF